MGSTLPPVIVTAVVTQQDMPYYFSLWEAAMVVALLSRTRSANKICLWATRKRQERNNQAPAQSSRESPAQIPPIHHGSPQ
jgi:hypothetical protein